MDTSDQQQPSQPNDTSNIPPEGQEISGSDTQNYALAMDSQQQPGNSEYIMESNAEYEDNEEGEYPEEEGHEEHLMGNEHEYYNEEEGEEHEHYDQEEMEEDQEGMPQELEGSGMQYEQSGLQPQIRVNQSEEGEITQYQPDSPASALKKISYDGEDADIEELFSQDFELVKRIRKMLLNNINKERINHEMHYLSIDIITNLLATDYAYHLTSNPHEPTTFQMISDKHHNIGEISLIWINSKFEEDVRINENVLMETFEEIGLILLESTEERSILLDPNNTHIGLGIAATDTGVTVVQIISQKIITIRRIQEGEDGGVEIKGTMLDDKFGIMACRVLNVDTNKDMLIVGPEKIDFDRKTKDFTVFLTFESPFKGQRNLVIEYFVRINPDSIPYRKPSRDKLKLKEYKLELRTPCIIFPDLKMMDKDEVDKPYFSLTADKALKKDAISPKRKIETPNIDKRLEESPDTDRRNEEVKDSMEMPSKIGNSQAAENEDKVKKIAFEQAKEQAISNKEIKEELEISLAEAQKQYDELLQQNLLLQEKIKTLKNKSDVIVDRQGDVAMNEHKYLNTLAHVHQIRLDLKQTQDKYNKMAADLQKKLEEKQKKCNEIKMTFMELKREVARKAAFSRTDKPIPEKMIDEWEERELEKNKILQELRLDILRLRNNLAKNKKILKKKEELAEGLHLIDFEQLKIENQTLNEKIEERNEDLHKLKKKNTTTVQILTHTREKLGFVQKKNDELEKIGKEKENDLGKKRKDLSKLKKDKDDLRTKHVKLKQQSGIVNTDDLLKDFNFIKSNIKKLNTMRDQLKEKRDTMEKVIRDYDRTKGKIEVFKN